MAAPIAARKPAANGRGARFTTDVSARRDSRMSKTRVLVVDDEAAILRFLKPALEANGYEMISAGTVAEALKRGGGRGRPTSCCSISACPMATART